MKTLLKTLTLSVAFLIVSNANAQSQILGEWLNADKNGKVEIYKVEENYFGKISWIKNPNNPDGTPQRDVLNPDTELRNQTIVGLVIMKNLQYDGDDEWEDGTIYDPDSGKTYSCTMEIDENGVLGIRGYIGFSLLGQTTEWTKVK